MFLFIRRRPFILVTWRYLRPLAAGIDYSDLNETAFISIYVL